MRKPVAILVLSCASAWLQMPLQAVAQNFGSYNAPTYTPPTLSPYLNLGVNANGLSNYQTFVRPMIDEQEMLLRQSIALQQLQRQVATSPRGQEPPEPAGRNTNSRGQQPVRFMHYSHYYPTRQ